MFKESFRQSAYQQQEESIGKIIAHYIQEMYWYASWKIIGKFLEKSWTLVSTTVKAVIQN